MLKQASFFKRRPDLSPEAFHDYWRNRHPEVVCRIPGLRRYVQNHVIGDDSPFDGIAEVWFEDMDAMRANVGAPELDAVRADEAHFIDGGTMASIVSQEHTIVEGTPGSGAEKLMGLVHRRMENAPERFQEIYRNEMGTLVGAVPGVVRYVQAHCRLGIYRSGREPACDAVASLWFSDRERALASPEMARVRGRLHRLRADARRLRRGGGDSAVTEDCLRATVVRVPHSGQ